MTTQEKWEEIYDALDNMDIKYDTNYCNSETEALIEFWTDTAGQDIPTEFDYDGTPEDFVKQFTERAEMYDVDEEVELCIGMRGKNGVPNTVRELLDDCQEAKDTLMEIARKLQKVLTMESDYMFVSIKDIANKLRRCDGETEIGFTNDTEDDIEVNGEPTGWYGVMITHMFDGKAIVFGYYGGGIVSFEDSERNYEDILIDFFKNEFNVDCTEDSAVCVDKDDWLNEINIEDYRHLSSYARDTIGDIKDDQEFCEAEFDLFREWYKLKGFTEDDKRYVENCGYDLDQFYTEDDDNE